VDMICVGDSFVWNGERSLDRTGHASPQEPARSIAIDSWGDVFIVLYVTSQYRQSTCSTADLVLFLRRMCY